MSVAAVALATGTVFLTPGLSSPAGAVWDASARLFYVSSAPGKPEAKDGRGRVAVLGEDGRILAPSFAAGLNAPKGLALAGGRLYAADVDQLDVIDVKDGSVLARLPARGARSLADAAAAPDGSVFVSDPQASSIWRLSPDGRFEVWASGPRLEGPAGLRVRGGRLYVAARGLAGPDGRARVPGRVYWLDLRTKARTDVSKAPLGALGGLEPASGGGWLVTDPEAGRLWRVADPSGDAELLDEGLKGPGDIGYDGKRRLVVVPLSGDDAVEGLDQAKLPR